MEQKQNKMAVMPMGKLLVNMSLPLMLSLIIQSLYNIVDSIFVSRLSQDALTATSLAYPVQFLMIAISVGTAVGLNALMSRKVGQNDPHGAGTIATTGLILCLITALIFSLTGIFFSDALAHSFTDDPEIAALTARYMSICVSLCYGIFLETLAQRMLTAVGLTTLSMVSLIVGAVTNIILDPIMIFGYFGFPSLGIAGAAIATVIGQWAGAATALLLNLKKNPSIHFIRYGYQFRLEDVAKIYKIGLPTMVMQAVGSVMITLINKVLMPVSSSAVAFFGAYYKLQGFVMMPMNGLGQAAIPIAAFNLGASDRQRIRELWKLLVPAAMIFALLGTVVFVFMPSALLSLFSAGDEMLAIGIPALRIIGVTFPLAAYVIVSGYFCSGLGNGLVNMIGGALRQLIVLVPCFVLLLKTMGLAYAWYAFWLSETTAFVFCLFAVRYELKTKASE